jgi:hypothetical protein
MLIDNNLLRLLVWTITDGSFDRKMVRFKISKPRKIERLTNLLNDLKIPFHHSIANSLQAHQTILPNRISINTKESSPIFQLLSDKKECPSGFKDLSIEQARILFIEYSNTDGCWLKSAPNTLEISSSNYNDIEILKSLNDKYFNCKIWEHERMRINNNFKASKPNTLLRLRQIKTLLCLKEYSQ